MDSILDKIAEWLKTMLTEGIITNLSGMFDSVNQKVGEIAGQVGLTPAGWNAGVFSLIRSLSESVIIPIAGVILAFVMTYELIQMVIDRNNLHDLDTWIFFKWIFKTFVAVLLVSHTFDIVMGIFDMAQAVVNGAAGVISTNASVDLATAVTDLETKLLAMELGPLFGLWFQSLFIGLTMHALSLCIFLIIYGRMIEIYLVTSVGPIPMAAMVNRDELCCKGVRTTCPTKSTAAGSFVADLAGLGEEGDEVYCDSRSRCFLLGCGGFTPPQTAHTPHTAAKKGRMVSFPRPLFYRESRRNLWGHASCPPVQNYHFGSSEAAKYFPSSKKCRHESLRHIERGHSKAGSKLDTAKNPCYSLFTEAGRMPIQLWVDRLSALQLNPQPAGYRPLPHSRICPLPGGAGARATGVVTTSLGQTRPGERNRAGMKAAKSSSPFAPGRA